MFLAVIGFAIVHIWSKIEFTRKSTITNLDWMLFYGIFLSVVFAITSVLWGVELAIHNLPIKGVLIMAGSVVASLILNLCLLKSISMISVGKSTLIYSSNPLFSVLLYNKYWFCKSRKLIFSLK